MNSLKRFFKRNSHNIFFKILGEFGLSLYRFYENRNHDIYSNGEINVIKKIGKLNPKIIFDGGANIGKYSLTLNKHIPDAKIFAFEPVKNTFVKLTNAISGIENIKPFNIGLFSENGEQEINLFSSDTHSSIYDIQGISYSSLNKTKIQLIKGDDFIKENKIEKIDFLKLDLEGAEFEALKGFEESIKKGIIRAIQFEYGYINISTRKLLIDYFNFFEKNNYITGKIYPKKVEFNNYNIINENFIGPNYIAVLKNDSEIISLLSQK